MVSLVKDALKKKSRRGFAAMKPERQQEIAAMGGRRAHQLGKSHEWNSEEAAAAGRVGGAKGAGKRKARKSN